MNIFVFYSVFSNYFKDAKNSSACLSIETISTLFCIDIINLLTYLRGPAQPESLTS